MIRWAAVSAAQRWRERRKNGVCCVFIKARIQDYLRGRETQFLILLGLAYSISQPSSQQGLNRLQADEMIYINHKAIELS